jgi:hypothetical protein
MGGADKVKMGNKETSMLLLILERVQLNTEHVRRKVGRWVVHG